MQRSNKLLSIIVGATALAIAPMIHAAGDAMGNLANGESIFKSGKGDVPACISCHGQDGMGDDNLRTPRLAGQISQFILKQLTDFATDKREDTTMFVMNANAKGLSEQDRIDVSGYLSQLGQTGVVNRAPTSNIKELVANDTEVGKSHLGKAIVNFGDLDRGISACRSCHGFNGRGVDPIYPKIGQQRYTYLVDQLNKWRDGSRHNDLMEQMQIIARQLTDDDIKNVATYLTAAPPTTPGNMRTPEQHSFMAFDPQ